MVPSLSLHALLLQGASIKDEEAKPELPLLDDQPRGIGSSFYPMRQDCMFDNPNHAQARDAWRRSVIEELAAQGRIVERSMIR